MSSPNSLVSTDEYSVPLVNFLFPKFKFRNLLSRPTFQHGPTPNISTTTIVENRKVSFVVFFLSLTFILIICGAVFLDLIHLYYTHRNECVVFDHSSIQTNSDENLYYVKATVSWNNNSEQLVVDHFCTSNSENEVQKCLKEHSDRFECFVRHDPIGIRSTAVLTDDDYLDSVTNSAVISVALLISLSIVVGIVFVLFSLCSNGRNLEEKLYGPTIEPPKMNIDWENPTFQFKTFNCNVGYHVKNIHQERERQQLTSKLFENETIELYEYANPVQGTNLFLSTLLVNFILLFVLGAITVLSTTVAAILLCINISIMLKLIDDHFDFNAHYLITNRRIIVYRPRFFKTVLSCIDLRNIKSAWVVSNSKTGLLASKGGDLCVEFMNGERGVLLNRSLAPNVYVDLINGMNCESLVEY